MSNSFKAQTLRQYIQCTFANSIRLHQNKYTYDKQFRTIFNDA
jgi:hypothetical protein